MHVHIVGNGSGGTGCWLRVRGWHRPLAALMSRHIGLPPGAMGGELDRLYVERLLDLVARSSLGAAVILARTTCMTNRPRHGRRRIILRTE
jgi:hypothetical protein